MSGLQRQVVALLQRRDDAGELVFSNDEVKEAVPLLCLGLKRACPSIELPAFALECMAAVAARAGVQSDTPDEAVAEKIETYYAASRSPLVRELELVLRALIGATSLDAAQRLAEAMGGKRSLEPLQSGVRPQGTTPAGPSARFDILAKFQSEGSPRMGKAASRGRGR